MDRSLDGKRILICQPMMHWICGSTVVTLELAEFLKSIGMNVEIYTCFFDEPLKTICNKKKIKVTDASSSPDYDILNFDFIWSHSQILPLSIIRQLSNRNVENFPKFIFLHMSGMDWIPDEKPWIYGLENKISDKSLFISEEVRDINRELLAADIQKDFFRNPAPHEYSLIENKNEKLKNILIVSNHPPKELIEASEILKKKYRINVDMMGENREKYTLCTPEIIEQYDAVITIAKTTQYCLVAGMPVFIYDSFSGGVGWLNEKNLNNAMKRNFSGYQNKFYPDYIGDGFSKMTPSEISKKIVLGFDSAKKFQIKNRNKFIRLFDIQNVLPNILSDFTERKREEFSHKELSSFLAAEQFAIEKFKIASFLHNQDQNCLRLERELEALKVTLDENEHIIKEQQKCMDAKSYKLYKKLISPISKIKNR